MRVFVGYCFTGNPSEILFPRIEAVLGALRSRGDTTYCHLVDCQNWGETSEPFHIAVKHAIEAIATSDLALFDWTSSTDSRNGIRIEIGAALGLGIPMVGIIERSDSTIIVPELFAKILDYETTAELSESVSRL